MRSVRTDEEGRLGNLREQRFSSPALDGAIMVMAIGSKVSPPLPSSSHLALHILRVVGTCSVLDATWSFDLSQRCPPILGNQVFLMPRFQFSGDGMVFLG